MGPGPAMTDKRRYHDPDLNTVEEIAFGLDTPVHIVKKRILESGVPIVRPARDVFFLTKAAYDAFIEWLQQRPRMGRPRKPERSAQEAARSGRPRPARAPKRLAPYGGAGEHVLGRPKRRKVVALELERKGDWP